MLGQRYLIRFDLSSADDHAVGQLVNNRLVLNYDRIDRAVAEVLIGAPQRPVLTKIAQSKTRLDVFQGDHATSILVALRPPAVASRLRSLTVASPQPVERSGDCAQVATLTRRARNAP